MLILYFLLLTYYTYRSNKDVVFILKRLNIIIVFLVCHKIIYIKKLTYNKFIMLIF